jgi:Protein tyrosine and serine/threonine kinase
MCTGSVHRPCQSCADATSGAKSLTSAALQTVYSFGDALRWTTQLAQGLAYLHAHRPLIIHRDLKLENCLLTGAIAPLPTHVHACNQRHVCCLHLIQSLLSLLKLSCR